MRSWALRLLPLCGTPPCASVAPPPAAVRPGVLGRFAQDASCFTQGLQLSPQGDTFFVSCGLYESSSLREAEVTSGRVRRRLALGDEYFAEGLALLPGGRLLQLTWRAGLALEYDAQTFALRRSLQYPGEGWGLCYDDISGTVVMSDGSSALTLRDPATFAAVRSVNVRLGGNMVQRLNELECVEGHVYANIWFSDEIVRIDPRTGEVDCVLDASGLLTPAEASVANVLNGIAFDNATRHFYITGKQWPWVFRADFGACSPNSTGTAAPPTAPPSSTSSPEERPGASSSARAAGLGGAVLALGAAALGQHIPGPGF